MIDHRTFSSGSANLSAQQSGSGPAIVLLHPGVADQRCWTAMTRRLESSHSVVTYDRRGFGATTYVEELHDPVDDLLAVLDGFKLGSVHLIGNSIGGGLAIDFALRHPNRVERLVLISAAIAGAPTPDSFPDSVSELTSEIDRLEALGDLDATNELEACLWLDGPSRPAGSIAGQTRDLFLDMNGVALRAPWPGQAQRSDDPPAWDRLGAVATRTLCLAGDHDLPHLRDRMATVAGMMSDATFAALPASAHLPQLDDPEHLADAVKLFLSQE